MDAGSRLKAERQRLGMTQEAFGTSCGVLKGAQINYESGKRHPDTDYLAAAAQIGVDVLYVITGQRSAASVAEQQLLASFRASSSVLQQAALAVLGVQAASSPPPASFVGATGSEVGQVVQGTSVNQDRVDIRIGSKKRGRKA